MTVAVKPQKIQQAPSPKGIPILGNLPQMKYEDHPFENWLALHQEYGDIIQMQVGPRKIFLIRDPDIRRELFCQ